MLVLCRNTKRNNLSAVGSASVIANWVLVTLVLSKLVFFSVLLCNNISCLANNGREGRVLSRRVC